MKDLTDAEHAHRFVEVASAAAGFILDQDEITATAEQFRIVAGLAALLPTDLPDDLEPAPRFEP